MYRINGYDLFLAFGILPSKDRTTADSFEKPADTVEAFSHTWDDGVVEYDLLTPIRFNPRQFIIKGKLIAERLSDYEVTKQAISSILYEPYVTLEATHLGIIANARIKSVPTWNRLTNLNGRICVAVQFQFDEVLQEVPYKDNGTLNITYLVDGQERIYTTQDNKYMTI